MFLVSMCSKERTWIVILYLLSHSWWHIIWDINCGRPPAVFASAYFFLFSKPLLCRPMQFSVRSVLCKVGIFTLYLQLIRILAIWPTNIQSLLLLTAAKSSQFQGRPPGPISSVFQGHHHQLKKAHLCHFNHCSFGSRSSVTLSASMTPSVLSKDLTWKQDWDEKRTFWSQSSLKSSQCNVDYLTPDWTGRVLCVGEFGAHREVSRRERINYPPQGRHSLVGRRVALLPTFSIPSLNVKFEVVRPSNQPKHPTQHNSTNFGF